MLTMKRLILTQRDHGRPIDPEQFDLAKRDPNYHFEIIDGSIYVSPIANLPHDRLKGWLHAKLWEYVREHPETIKYLSTGPRVFVPGRPKATQPEPDLAAYDEFPRDTTLSRLRWQDISPCVVVEIVSDEKPEKDLDRNVHLYLEVPSIKEYWIVDPRADPDRPSLIVYRRRGKVWQKPIEVEFGAIYESPRLLPGFRLKINPDE